MADDLKLVNFKLNPDDRHNLRYLAALKGMTMTDYLRYLIKRELAEVKRGR